MDFPSYTRQNCFLTNSIFPVRLSRSFCSPSADRIKPLLFFDVFPHRSQPFPPLQTDRRQGCVSEMAKTFCINFFYLWEFNLRSLGRLQDWIREVYCMMKPHSFACFISRREPNLLVQPLAVVLASSQSNMVWWDNNKVFPGSGSGGISRLLSGCNPPQSSASARCVHLPPGWPSWCAWVWIFHHSTPLLVSYIILRVYQLN